LAKGNKFSVDFTYTDILDRTFAYNGDFVLVMSAGQEAAAGRMRRTILGGVVEVAGGRDDQDLLDTLYAAVQAQVTHRAIGPVPESWSKQGQDWPREALLRLGQAVKEAEEAELAKIRSAADQAREELRTDRANRKNDEK
jgi:hypothetical protein